MDKFKTFLATGRNILKYGSIAIILIKTIEFFFDECDKEFGDNKKKLDETAN